jgi:hypothetical protein
MEEDLIFLMDEYLIFSNGRCPHSFFQMEDNLIYFFLKWKKTLNILVDGKTTANTCRQPDQNHNQKWIVTNQKTNNLN